MTSKAQDGKQEYTTFCDDIYCSKPQIPTNEDFAWGKRAYTRRVANEYPDNDPEAIETRAQYYTEVRQFRSNQILDKEVKTSKLIGYAPANTHLYSYSEVLNEIPAGFNLKKYPSSAIDITSNDWKDLKNYESAKWKQSPFDLIYTQNSESVELTWKSNEQADYHKVYMSINDEIFNLIDSPTEPISIVELPKSGLIRFYVRSVFGNSISAESNLVEVAVNEDLPIRFTKLCYKSTPQNFNIRRNRNNLKMEWDILPSGVYPKDDTFVEMNYCYSIIYAKVGNSDFHKIGKTFDTDFEYNTFDNQTYSFYVEAVYNDTQISPNSKVVTINRSYKDRFENMIKQEEFLSAKTKEPKAKISRNRFPDLNHIFISYSNIEGGDSGIIVPANSVMVNENNQNEAPLLNDDFSLQENSVCIDNGNPNLLDPDNTTSDIGALFYDQLNNIVVVAISPEPGEIEIVQNENLDFSISAFNPLGANLLYNWELDNQEVGADSLYNFDASQLGEFALSLNVVTADERRNELNYQWAVSVVEPENTEQNETPLLQTKLLGNFPNPFSLSSNSRSSHTEIGFYLEKESAVEISIYNVKGQEIKKILDENCPKGLNQIYWNGQDSVGKDVSSGIYFYVMKTDKKQFSKKMLVVKQI